MLRWGQNVGIVALLGVMISSSACRTNTSAGPSPSATGTVPPPPPPAVAAPVAAFAVIPVQVTYVLRTLQPTLDSLFPARDSLSAAQCTAARGLVCHQYVYRRDSLQLRGIGDRMQIGTQLAYRAQVGALGRAGLAGCGYAPETPRRAALSMNVALYWRRDWRIGARDTRLEATLQDPCRIGGLDATPTLQALIDRQLAGFAAQVDSAIPRAANFQPLADSLWRSFSAPMALDSAGTLWLLLDPETVRVVPFAGTGPSLTTALVLYARPRVVSGARPSARGRPLPPLSLGEAPSRFTVPVTVELPFADVGRRASELLAAETRTGSVHVDSVQVRGRGDTVLVDLAVSGTLRGQLAMVSRVRWDADTRELRLDDLEWTLESRNALTRVAATLGAPLVSRAIRRATSGGRISVGGQLDATRSELMRKLNGPMGAGAMMGGSVTTLQITTVTTSRTALLVQARLEGTSGVWFQR